MNYYGKKHKKAKIIAYVPEVTKKKMDILSTEFGMTQSDMAVRAVEDLYEKLLEAENEALGSDDEELNFGYTNSGDSYEIESTTELLEKFKKRKRIQSEVSIYESIYNSPKTKRIGRLKRNVSFTLSPMLSDALEEVADLLDLSVRSIMTFSFIHFIKELELPIETEE